MSSFFTTHIWIAILKALATIKCQKYFQYRRTWVSPRKVIFARRTGESRRNRLLRTLQHHIIPHIRIRQFPSCLINKIDICNWHNQCGTAMLIFKVVSLNPWIKNANNDQSSFEKMGGGDRSKGWGGQRDQIDRGLPTHRENGGTVDV